jgi:hypothetical protein
VFSADCAGDVAEIVIQWGTSIALQTVGVKTDLESTGAIFSRDASTSVENYCQDQTSLNGFHKCEMWTDNLVI